MIPAAVEYLRPTSIGDALEALADPEAKVLAGGHSLVPMMKLRLARPSCLVDISGLDFRGVTEDDGAIRIGALTTYEELLRQDTATLPDALSEAAAAVGDLQIRNAGTIGGGIAHGDPASDVAAGVLAVEATLRLQSTSGARECRADEFFEGPFSTALGQQELLIEIVVPRPGPGEGSAYRLIEDAASGYALAGAAVRVRIAGGRIESCSIGFTGVGSHPSRATAVERGVVGTDVASAVDAAGAAVDSIDVSASGLDPEYARHLAGVVLGRAMAAACTRAQNGGTA